MTSAFLSLPSSERSLYIELSDELSARGIDVFRIDDIEFGSNWQANILSAIKRADVLIAHVGFGNMNSNVLFELGIAIGSGTPVVLVSDGPSEIPFDLATLPVFVPRKSGIGVIDEIVDYVTKLTPRTEHDSATFQTARAHLQAAVNDPDILEQISPKQFEELLTNYFVELGFDANLIQGPTDTGFDIVLDIPGIEPVAIVVKKYTRQGKLGIADVQRVVGASVVAGVECVLLITTGGFTTSAMGFAANAPMRFHLFTIGDFLLEDHRSITMRCTEAADGA